MKNMTKKKKETRTNKRKSEQFHYDMRHDLAWDFYTDHKSATFNNAFQSAIKAGYAPSTAKCITAETWWQKKVESLAKLMPKAEDNLQEDLEMDTYTSLTISGGKKNRRNRKKVTGEEDDDLEDYDDEEEEEVKTIKIINPKLRKIRQEATFFVLETLGRKRYHKKVEMENTSNISLVEGNKQLDDLFRKKK